MLQVLILSLLINSSNGVEKSQQNCTSDSTRKTPKKVITTQPSKSSVKPAHVVPKIQSLLMESIVKR